MRTKTLIIVALAFAAGGACPSDVNNDGTVGINDFLQLLGDWGPCPAPVIVSIDAGSAGMSPAIARLWSDGRVEVAALGSASFVCDGCSNFPVFQWIDLGVAPPPSGSSHPVDVTMSDRVHVEYSDGTTLQCIFTCGADKCSFDPIWTVVKIVNLRPPQETP